MKYSGRKDVTKIIRVYFWARTGLNGMMRQTHYYDPRDLESGDSIQFQQNHSGASLNIAPLAILIFPLERS